MKTRICDICDKHYQKWKFKARFVHEWFPIFGFGSKFEIEDVCDECFEEFKTFLRLKKADLK
jgi:hypothetical protein